MEVLIFRPRLVFRCNCGCWYIEHVSEFIGYQWLVCAMCSSKYEMRSPYQFDLVTCGKPSEYIIDTGSRDSDANNADSNWDNSEVSS